MNQVLGAIELIDDRLRGRFFGDLYRLVVLLGEARGQHRRLLGVELDIDGPVLALDKGADLALAVDNQAQSHGLNAPGRKPAPDFVPQEWRDLIAYQAIQNTARLLGVHQIQIHRTRLLESFLNGVGGDFIEHHPEELRSFLGTVQLFLQVETDGLTFAIRVSREVDGVHPLGRCL